MFASMIENDIKSQEMAPNDSNLMTQIQFRIWQDMLAWFVSYGNISIELIH
jgi:hypothetical protein